MLAIRRPSNAMDLRLELSTYAFMRTLRWCVAGAATERVTIRGVSTKGSTITCSHRLAGALRLLPAEPSKER